VRDDGAEFRREHAITRTDIESGSCALGDRREDRAVQMDVVVPARLRATAHHSVLVRARAGSSCRWGNPCERMAMQPQAAGLPRQFHVLSSSHCVEEAPWR
jgi:hypothetical protein